MCSVGLAALLTNFHCMATSNTFCVSADPSTLYWQEDGYVPVICGMGRTVLKDLERTWEAVRHAKRPRVHMVLATSEIHLKHKLKMTRGQVPAACIESGRDAHTPASPCYYKLHSCGCVSTLSWLQLHTLT
eukprot:GHUV01030240.1.p1 GENE.GHUV01030240.1~~GHUV01030240.1.p1  ORF type:complete len:131 (+),score=12.00 GHUV01030240.1:40-432(+)